MTTDPIEIPCHAQVQKYLDLWQADASEAFDDALRRLYEFMPINTDVGEVGVKVSALNALYAT